MFGVLWLFSVRVLSLELNFKSFLLSIHLCLLLAYMGRIEETERRGSWVHKLSPVLSLDASIEPAVLAVCFFQQFLGLQTSHTSNPSEMLWLNPSTCKAFKTGAPKYVAKPTPSAAWPWCAWWDWAFLQQPDASFFILRRGGYCIYIIYIIYI